MIILRVNDLSKHYGENVVLDRIGFTVEEGERMGLVGPNGAGKTTLLRILTGQLEADGGSFAFSGSPTIGYLEQTADLDSQSTVWDELIKVYAPVFAMEQRMRELEQLMSALGDESQPGFAQYAQEYSRLMESFEAVSYTHLHPAQARPGEYTGRVPDERRIHPFRRQQPGDSL